MFLKRTLLRKFSGLEAHTTAFKPFLTESHDDLSFAMELRLLEKTELGSGIKLYPRNTAKFRMLDTFPGGKLHICNLTLSV